MLLAVVQVTFELVIQLCNLPVSAKQEVGLMMLFFQMNGEGAAILMHVLLH